MSLFRIVPIAARRAAVTMALCFVFASAASAGTGTGIGQDCRKARDPVRCEAAENARLACRDRRGTSFRLCFETLRLQLECAAADDPRACEARQKLRATCKGKRGRTGKECRAANAASAN